MLKDIGRNRGKRMQTIPIGHDMPQIQGLLPRPYMTGIRIAGFVETKNHRCRRNFYQTAAMSDDGSIQGFIIWKKLRYNGVARKGNLGYWYFHSNEVLP